MTRYVLVQFSDFDDSVALDELKSTNVCKVFQARARPTNRLQMEKGNNPLTCPIKL